MFDSKVDRDLGQKNIGSLLLQYSLPAIIATAATSVYNLVDRIFIGQIVGALAISGITITLPLMSICAAFGTLIGSGAASIISIRMGENRREEALKTLANALIFNLLISITISILGLIFLDDILILFGASEMTLPYAHTFMQIMLIGNPIGQTFFSLNTIMRASGYPAKAMWAVLLTMVVNFVCVTLFIYVFQFGIAGAAFATILGQAVGLVWVVSHFCKEESHIYFDRNSFSIEWSIAKHIFSIGLSPFLIHVCSCIVVAVINWQLSNYGGDYAIGAYGIINTVVNFITVIVLGLAQGMQPIVGYNFGAKQFGRVYRALWETICVGTFITIVGFLLMRFFPLQIAACFTSDFVLSDLVRNGMMIYTLMFSLIGFQVVASNFFQSIGHPHISIILSILRQIVFLIPLVVILPAFMGLNGIWYAMPAADLLATIVTALVLVFHYNKITKNENITTN